MTTMSNTLTPVEGRQTPALYVWAAIGTFFLLLQTYIFGSWIMSDDFGPVNPGDSVMPGYTSFAAIFFQILNPALAVAVVIWGVRQCLREGRVTVHMLFIMAWITTFWVDPLANMWRLVYTYNSHMVNMGSWANFIPGWVMPNGHLIPEPLVFNIGAYISIIPLQCFFCVWLMRKAKARWQTLGTLGLVGVAFLAMFIFDLILEGSWVRMGLYVFSGTVHSWSLFGGEWYQFPIYNSIFWGSVTGAASCVLYFRDDKGQMSIERGADSVASPVRRTYLRFAALSAVFNIAYVSYAICMSVVALHMDKTPELPTYLSNGICGEGTGYPCPGPNHHMPLPESGYVVPLDSTEW